MSDETKSRLHATVMGRVQGVSFRYFVVEQAGSLDLNGWVRNLWNGNVEVMGEGSHDNLETLLQALHKGPPMADVTNVNVELLEYAGEYSDFRVRSSST